MTPWLSVIVPVFNGDDHLESALESVAAQNDPGIELVVSDDGSTDRSCQIIDSFAMHRPVRVVSGPAKGNWVANTNAAVAHARGDLVAILHQDDLWLPGRAAAVRAAVAAAPGRGLWVSPARFVGSDGGMRGTWRLPFRPDLRAVEAGEFVEHLLVQNFLAMPAPVFTRRGFHEAGGMDETLWYTADWDLWLRLGGSSGASITHIPTTAFRLHRKSQTVRRAGAHAEMRMQILAVLDRHLSRIGDGATRLAVEKAARFACELNCCLAAAVSGGQAPWRRVATAFWDLGPAGARRFIKDARLLERSVARLRVGLAREAT